MECGEISQVVGNVVLAWVGPGFAREGKARQRAVTGGSEEAKRIPPPCPGSSKSVSTIDEQHITVSLLEEIAESNTGLAGTDNGDFGVFRG